MCTSAIAQKRNCAAAEIAIVKLCKDEIVQGSGLKIASVKIGNVQAMQDCAKSETCMYSGSNCSKEIAIVRGALVQFTRC